MATWIVHLRIADNLLEIIGGLHPGYFALGNVAPDSGIPDENWEKFDPPPEILHFFAGEGSKWELADLEFYKRYLADRNNSNIEGEIYSFHLGYFFHLATDNLWSEKVDKPTRVRFTEEFEADEKFIWKVKHDWYGLDFLYLRSHPESLFWRVFLGSEYDRDCLDILPVEAVRERVRYIKDLYQQKDEKRQHWLREMPCIYLTADEMDEFVQYATGKLYEVYNILFQKPLDLPDVDSSLELVIED
jgi:hypothetical protein